MAIQLTWNEFKGLLSPGTMKKHPDIKYVHNPGSSTEKTFYMYTYNIEIPFEPAENPVYEHVVFLDVHGNEYKSADNIICAKLDIAMLYADDNRANLINALPDIEGIGASFIGSYNISTLGLKMFYKLENDFFDPFDYTPLLNGTDGWLPWEITKPSDVDFMPFPVYCHQANQPPYLTTVKALNTLSESTETDKKLALLKLNTPMYFADNNNYALNRIILYGKPFLG